MTRPIPDMTCSMNLTESILYHIVGSLAYDTSHHVLRQQNLKIMLQLCPISTNIQENGRESVWLVTCITRQQALITI